MTTERQPTAQDILALVDFLPKLYGDGARPPAARWITETEDGALVLPWPEYDETVRSFIDLIVNQGCWMDPSYVPEEAERLLLDEAAVGDATIPEIQRMLTVVVGGERFCEGWWSSMIEDGHIRRLLERLAEIESAGLGATARRRSRWSPPLAPSRLGAGRTLGRVTPTQSTQARGSRAGARRRCPDR